MEVSQHIAVSGLLAHQRQLDVVSNNIANVSTTGFKQARVHTSDTGYQAGLTAPVGPGGAPVRIVGVGEGTHIAAVRNDFAIGAPQPTGNQLDVAIGDDGSAYFEVALPDGTTALTRDGSFRPDATGRLATASGYPIRSHAGTDLVLPEDATSAGVGQDGQVYAELADGTTEAVGTLALVRVRNPDGLVPQGQNLWQATAESGEATAIPAEARPQLLAGALEGSNVDMADEFTRLVTAQRGYQMNLRMVQAWDEVERMAIEVRR